MNPRWMSALCALCLFASCTQPQPPCVEGTEESCPDPGSPPADLCNSREEALADPTCLLTLGQARSAFIGASGDQDWYLLQLPSTLTARSLVHLTAGYAAPNTAVNLTVGLLREDGQVSLARKIDRHGQAAPKPLDIVLPFAEPGAKLLVLVSDEGAGVKPNFDVRSPYSLTAEVLENPDVNEPNDTVATDIPLVGQAGAQSGYLATDDDVDRFSFTVPAGRKVLYLALTAAKKSPPPPFRLGYVLLDPSGKQVSEGQAQNEFLAVSLATARLTTAGKYTVVVSAYRDANVAGPIGGDLAFPYALSLQLFDEADANEPNDTAPTAKAVSLASPGASATSLTGRLGHVPDPDWFAVDLPASTRPTVLSIKVTPTPGGGRFPPLAPLADRQLRVFTDVASGATAAERQNNCKTNASLCPKGYEGSALFQQLVEGFCAAGDPPRCLWAERNEHPAFAALRNLETTLPVAPHTGTVRYFVLVQDDANNYADDRDYTLTLRWLTDPDEELRVGLPNQTESLTLEESTSFPAPPASSEQSGTLSHGYGRVLRHDVNGGQGMRGPEDYDAVPSDVDRYQLDFPILTAPLDWAWTLEWDLASRPDGGVPSELSLELEFCDGDAPGAANGCVSVSDGLTLAYSPGPLAPWYSSLQADRQPLWQRAFAGTKTTVSALPAGCFCVEPRFVRGGKFFLKVAGVDRNDAAPTEYRLRTGLASYPRGYTTEAGLSRTCPGSCQFTR